MVWTALWLLGCAGGPVTEAPVPAVEPAPAAAPAPEAAPAPTGPMSPEVRVKVEVDAPTQARLEAIHEEIVVNFSVFDSPIDGTFRDVKVNVGPSGGVATIPPISLAPGPSGTPLNNWSVDAYTARKGDPLNLISCAVLGEEGVPPVELTLSCKLI